MAHDILNMIDQYPKLAIVTTHAIQHFVPVYQRLAEHYGVDLKVFYIGENGVKDSVDKDFGVSYSWDLPLLDGYQHVFVNPGKIIQNFSFREVDCTTINDVLNDYQPDFVWLNGYWAMVNWRVLIKQWSGKLFLSRTRKKPRAIIYSSDSNLQDYRNWFKKAVKQLLVRFFIKHCDRYVSVSEQNRRYLEHYGALADSIEDACYPIDMKRLMAQRDALTEKDRQELRAHYGINKNAFVVIFAGKLIDHKRPIDLIHALTLLKKQKRECVILYMGDGEQREEITSTAKRLGVEDQIALAGFVNQSDIARHLFASDVLALPSHKEPFGAVVSEALPFGLPIVAADQIGAVGIDDAAQPERNAIVYPWGDIEALAKAIERLSMDKLLYEQFRQHSLSIVDMNDVDVYCQALLKFLHNDDVNSSKQCDNKNHA